MLRARLERRSYVESVGKKITLRVTQVRTVEPHIRLVEDAVHRQPRPLASFQRLHLEPPPVEKRAVRAGEGGFRTPVARHHQWLPTFIVQVGTWEAAAQIFVRFGRHPCAAEVGLFYAIWRRRAHVRGFLISLAKTATD